MQFVIQYCEQHDASAIWRKMPEKSHYRVSGADIFVGRPSVDVKFLDRLSCSSIMIVPHFCKRGPNGLWVISRAANHHLERAFRERSLYYLRTERFGVFVHEIDDARKIYSLELFRSRRQAEECAAAQRGASHLNLDVGVATGSQLLRLISSVDVIAIGTTRVAITREGMLFDNRSPLVSPDGFLALIDDNSHGNSAISSDCPDLHWTNNSIAP
jgi:hypothetical protein